MDSADEIGELAAALNRVQATAALLLERQVTTRSNVAVMFANIARRTQNLVGRQLTLIDELERNERDPELLQRLYRLDHVATRLRRSADSLLVVSGTIDQQLSGTPTRLADIIRSALAEIEGYRAVELGEIVDVAVSADLVAGPAPAAGRAAGERDQLLPARHAGRGHRRASSTTATSRSSTTASA